MLAGVLSVCLLLVRAASGESTCSADGGCEAALVDAQQAYKYTHEKVYTDKDGNVVATLKPIAVMLVDDAHPLPDQETLRLVQIADIGLTVADLVANLFVKLTNVIGWGRVPTYGVVEKAVAHRELEVAVDKLLADVASLSNISNIAMSLHSKSKKSMQERLSLGGLLEEAIRDALKNVLDLAVQLVAKLAGLSGRPQSMNDYTALFQMMPLPDAAAGTSDDMAFARLRLAGPNPMVIAQLMALTENFPVDAARYQTVMDNADTLEAALDEGRLFVADYQVLEVQEPGMTPTRKYPTAPLALFAVPPSGAADRALRPVAIQCGQQHDAQSTPVLYPDDGQRWEIAKMHVSAADGNHHELISHLGVTHLLIEPFVVSAHRQLTPDHPLFALLIPHFQGTLFINNAAIESLIAPDGTVDKLLSGTIESDWEVVKNALGAVQFKDLKVPAALAARGVDNVEQLPDFPYRDDALLVWEAVRSFVAGYVALSYEDDTAVQTDAELQAFIAEVASTDDGGGVQGLVEAGSDGIATVDYLVDTLATIIFTASAQHAAVNFPQNDIMAFTPLMPLGAFSAPPTDSLTTETLLDHLPPLEQAVLQQLVGTALGGVYFTRLSDYNRHQPFLEPDYFTDNRVQAVLDQFAADLGEVERTIGNRNTRRATYKYLLPSRIPQSINI